MDYFNCLKILFLNVTLYSVSCFRGLLTQQSIHCHKICPIFFSAMMNWRILRDTVWFPSLMGKREQRKCNNYSWLFLICSPADVSSSSPLVSGQRLDSASWASDTVLVCRHPGGRRLELVSDQCTICSQVTACLYSDGPRGQCVSDNLDLRPRSSWRGFVSG